MRGTGYAIGEVLIFLIIATVIGLIAGYLLGRAQGGGAVTDEKLKQRNASLEEKIKAAERKESNTRSRLATAQDRISALQSENKELVEIAARRGKAAPPNEKAQPAKAQEAKKPEQAQPAKAQEAKKPEQAQPPKAQEAKKPEQAQPAKAEEAKKPAAAAPGAPAEEETDKALEDLEKKLKELSSQLDDLQS